LTLKALTRDEASQTSRAGGADGRQRQFAHTGYPYASPRPVRRQDFYPCLRHQPSRLSLTLAKPTVWCPGARVNLRAGGGGTFTRSLPASLGVRVSPKSPRPYGGRTDFFGNLTDFWELTEAWRLLWEPDWLLGTDWGL